MTYFFSNQSKAVSRVAGVLLTFATAATLSLSAPVFAQNAPAPAGTTPSATAPATTAPAAAPEVKSDAAKADMPKTEGAAGVKAPAPVTEENPYGLKAVWSQGEPVQKITLAILLIMSLGTWYIIITKLFEQSKMGKQGEAAKKSFWSAGTVRQGAESLDAVSPYRYIADQALKATEKHTGLLGMVDFNTWVTQGIDRAISVVQGTTQGGLAFLATVGSTAPFIGLFGTVMGIYGALVKIGMSGQASIDKVAGPVGESLIMTAVGLAVAVPAVLGYNWLVRRNKATMDNVREFGSDLHSVLLASQQKR
jgi:biopolymer transport protein ExbB